MLNLPSAFASHLGNRVTTLTVCWSVTKKNTEVLRGTAHQEDVIVTAGQHAGVYRRDTAVFATDSQLTADGAVSQLDVQGAFRVDAEPQDITVEDIKAGLYDQADAVLFLVNYADPDAGQKVIVSGTLGEFRRDSDGRYRSEVRGVGQALSQQMLESYSKRCSVKRFGDHRCKFDVASKTRTATVDSVTNRRTFSATLDAGPAPVTGVYYFAGIVKWTSGNNDGFESIVVSHNVLTTDGDPQTIDVILQDEAPADIESDDTFSLEPGCDRLAQTCLHVHDNFINFRGYGLYAVGKDRLMAGNRGNVDAAYSEALQLQAFKDALNEKFPGAFPS